MIRWWPFNKHVCEPCKRAHWSSYMEQIEQRDKELEAEVSVLRARRPLVWLDGDDIVVSDRFLQDYKKMLGKDRELADLPLYVLQRDASTRSYRYVPHYKDLQRALKIVSAELSTEA